MGTDVDVAIVGAGIVGLATARAVLLRHPGAAVTVFDKEDRIAAHQSGRNSGVIHAGVYYEAGSTKALLCARGRQELLAFCAEHGIATQICGKLVVATEPDELGRLGALRDRCEANGIATRLLRHDELHEIEPHVQGVRALHVPSTGIVDFNDVCAALADEVRSAGATIELGTPVTGWEESRDRVQLRTPRGRVACATFVNCGGLHSDRVAALDDPTAPTILPFRGEYHELVPERRHLVRGLIYPVPDPALPFLGVHLTRDIHGGVHAGPNAVLALGREAYDWRTFDGRDVAQMARTPSTWRLARRYARTEVEEVVRSLSTRSLVRALQRLVPDLRATDLVRAGAGIRAQAVAPDGSLLQDFAIRRSARAVHVLNAPSPAATASLAIGDHLAELALAS